MQTNIKRHLNSIYGLNSSGMKCVFKPEIFNFIKSDLKRTKTNEGIERIFSNQKQSKFRKPIFSKIEENGKKITYKVGI